VEGVALAHEFAPMSSSSTTARSKHDLRGGIRSLRGGSGTTTVLVLGAHVPGRFARQSIAAGASGAVEKTPRPRRACRRDSIERARREDDRRQALLPDVPAPTCGRRHIFDDRTSPGEREVLRLLNEGLDAPRIVGAARHRAQTLLGTNVQNVLVKFHAHLASRRWPMPAAGPAPAVN